MQTKRCNGPCGLRKPVAEFSKHRTYGHQSRCKECMKLYAGAGDEKPPRGGFAKPPEFAGDKLGQSESGDTLTLDSLSMTVRTVEDALRKAEVDTAIWDVERFTVNSWEVAMKMRAGEDEPDYVKTSPLWQVKVWLRRKAPKPFQDAAASLIERMKKHAPKYPKVARVKSKKPHLFEVCLFDAHFGKLAWAMETGQNYDLRIAEKVYLHAVRDLLNKASHYEVEKFVFPIGQDFFQVNNQASTTARGTPQDCDGRLFKVFDAGCAAVIEAIRYCAAIAPVEVPWVPGNHDPDTSWFMARYVDAWFHHCPEVTVDTRPTTRKFFTYGANGIMYTHGDEEAHRDLPAIMAAEERALWGSTLYNEIHTGHFHKKKQVSFAGADTFGGGVVVRTIPSLSSADAFHYRKGWNRSPRAADGFLWGKDPGLEAYFCTNVFSDHA
jgi:hypothetical protein